MDPSARDRSGSHCSGRLLLTEQMIGMGLRLGNWRGADAAVPRHHRHRRGLASLQDARRGRCTRGRARQGRCRALSQGWRERTATQSRRERAGAGERGRMRPRKGDCGFGHPRDTHRFSGFAIYPQQMTVGHQTADWTTCHSMQGKGPVPRAPTAQPRALPL